MSGSGRFEHATHEPGTSERARDLRREMTASEKKLWAALRKLDLNIRRQAPIGRYIGDFVQHSARLVVEVDGARHGLEASQLHDALRDDWLKSQGYKVLRVSDERAYGDPWSVADEVSAVIKQRLCAQYASSGERGDTPPPNPPPLRGRAP